MLIYFRFATQSGFEQWSNRERKRNNSIQGTQFVISRLCWISLGGSIFVMPWSCSIFIERRGKEGLCLSISSDIGRGVGRRLVPLLLWLLSSTVMVCFWRLFLPLWTHVVPDVIEQAALAANVVEGGGDDIHSEKEGKDDKGHSLMGPRIFSPKRQWSVTWAQIKLSPPKLDLTDRLVGCCQSCQLS